jgi:hypothetical protein
VLGWLGERVVATLCLPKIPSGQVRELKAGRWIPGVMALVDHLGTAAWEVINTAS